MGSRGSSLADRYNMQQDCGGSTSVRRALVPKGTCGGGVLGPDLAARKSLSDRTIDFSSLVLGKRLRKPDPIEWSAQVAVDLICNIVRFLIPSYAVVAAL